MHLNKLQRSLLEIMVVVVVAIILFNVYRPELTLLIHPGPAQQQKLIALVHHHRFGDIFLLIITIALLCSIPFAPNSVVCVFAGICFGPIGGFIINWCGNIIGNSFVITLIHFSGVSDKIRHRKAFDYLTRQRFPAIGLTIGFIIPIIPNLLVNCAASGLKVSNQKYLIAVSLGTLPIAFLYALGGNAIFTMSWQKIALVIGLFIALCLCYWGLKRLQSKLPN